MIEKYPTNKFEDIFLNPDIANVATHVLEDSNTATANESQLTSDKAQNTAVNLDFPGRLIFGARGRADINKTKPQADQ